ncbi:hypothetical protein Hanom_Chr11g01064551 [Helianthus anomalus]
MFTGEHPDDSAEEMSASLPPLKWSKEIFDGLVQNFKFPKAGFVLDILDYYKFHISQLNPMGMVRIRHFEIVCRSMHIEPTVDRFRVFY